MKDFTLDDIRQVIDISLESGAMGDDFIDARYEAHLRPDGQHLLQQVIR